MTNPNKNIADKGSICARTHVVKLQDKEGQIEDNIFSVFLGEISRHVTIERRYKDH